MTSQNNPWMYECSVPALLRTLTNLRHLLEKAAAHAEAKKIDSAVFVSSRLYPDMFPLSSQVQIACDNSKGCVARLTGVEAPKFEDKETTLAELIARIDKTLAFVQSVAPASFEGSEARAIELKTPRGSLHFKGWDYLRVFVLPNVYFHVVTAYNILRHNGVELGKFDYLGAVQ